MVCLHNSARVSPADEYRILVVVYKLISDNPIAQVVVWNAPDHIYSILDFAGEYGMHQVPSLLRFLFKWSESCTPYRNRSPHDIPLCVFKRALPKLSLSLARWFIRTGRARPAFLIYIAWQHKPKIRDTSTVSVQISCLTKRQANIVL